VDEPVSERRAYGANTISGRVACYRASTLVTVDRSIWRGTEVVATSSLLRRWVPPSQLTEREAIEVLISALQEIIGGGFG
jgi:hypothetical protein